MTYDGKLKDGVTIWTIETSATGALIRFTAGGDVLFPAPVVPPTPVPTSRVSSTGYVLATDLKSATFGGWKLVSAYGFWPPSLSTVLQSGSWKDTVTLSRLDGAVFVVNGQTVRSYTYPRTGQTNQKWLEFDVGTVPIPDPGPDLVRSHTFGIIADGDFSETNAAAMDDLKQKAIRIWWGYNPDTGKVNAARIATAHAYEDRGFRVVMILHPEPRVEADGKKTRVIPVDVDIESISPLRKSIRIHIGNEPNLGQGETSTGYWKDGDWEGAWVYFDRQSVRIRAIGYTTGTPSFAYQDAGEVKRRLELMKARDQMHFDVLVCHNYPTYDASYPAGKTAEFINLLKVYADKGLTWGMEVSVDEWGFYPSYKLADIRLLLPQWLNALELYADSSFYFIMNRVDRDPHRNFPWLINGSLKSVYYDIYKAAMQ